VTRQRGLESPFDVPSSEIRAPLRHADAVGVTGLALSAQGHRRIAADL
jgi:hypothetical protein